LSNKQRTGPRRLPDLPDQKAAIIKPGDLCIAFFNPFHQKLFQAQSQGMYDSKYGHYRFTDIIGKPYGTMVSKG
jgi:tRNA A58 N-methylase Trm61